MPERDPMLRRVERTSVVACAVIAVVAWAIARGGVAAPLGVVAGGALVGISYRGVKSGIDVLGGASGGPGESIEGGEHSRKAALALVKFFTRYGILAVAAYVIMARLRLPPVAVFAGASSLVVAVMVEALRGVDSGQRRNTGG